MKINNKHYIIEDGKIVKATKWKLFKFNCKKLIKRWKLVDSFIYRIIPRSEMRRFFELTPQEKIDADKVYEEKGSISYEFYPCDGLGWGVRVHVLKTGEIINITDVSNW